MHWLGRTGLPARRSRLDSHRKAKGYFAFLLQQLVFVCHKRQKYYSNAPVSDEARASSAQVPHNPTGAEGGCRRAWRPTLHRSWFEDMRQTAANRPRPCLKVISSNSNQCAARAMNEPSSSWEVRDSSLTWPESLQATVSYSYWPITLYKTVRYYRKRVHSWSHGSS